MHYTGMASVAFVPSATPPELTNAVSVASIGAVGITIVPLMVIVVALVTSFVDRLREQRALLDDLFEQAPQAVALMAGDGRIVRVNREFSQLFGYTSHEAVGRHLDEVIVPEDARDEDRRYADLVARGQRVEAECVCRRKDGRLLYVSMVRVPVSVPGGRVAIYAIYRDVSERKRSEGALQRSLEQLRALTGRLQTVREEERTRVAREIHDVLGQALTAIKLDVTALLRDAPTGKGAGIMRLLDETIQSVRRLATELRPGILDNLGLEAAVEWAAEDFEARTGTRVHVGLPAERLATDPERATALFRILQETLTNVARHASATRVDVRLASAGGSLILEMHDNGIGMSEVHLSSVASLGIMGMRERARLLGGEVTIRSASGQGTTVTVRIPDA
jgi:PAS domain S-box-containing protein